METLGETGSRNTQPASQLDCRTPRTAGPAASAIAVPVRVLGPGSHRGPGRMAPQGLHEGAFVCSPELCVPVTLPSLLHCPPLLRRLTAGPRKPRQETLFHAKVHPPPAPRFETHAGLAAPSPGNSVHILFWSVSDLFTQRSRFLLHTHFMLQKQKERDEVCAWLLAPVCWWGG